MVYIVTIVWSYTICFKIKLEYFNKQQKLPNVKWSEKIPVCKQVNVLLQFYFFKLQQESEISYGSVNDSFVMLNYTIQQDN